MKNCKMIWLSNQGQIIEKGKFTYSPLGKDFGNKQKQLKSKAKSK